MHDERWHVDDFQVLGEVGLREGLDPEPERNNMKNPRLYFRAYLAALLMLAAVPAEAADVKELFAIDLADYAGKEGRTIEVSHPPGARDVVHRHVAHALLGRLPGTALSPGAWRPRPRGAGAALRLADAGWTETRDGLQGPSC